MLTTAEAITTALRQNNQGSEGVAYDGALRDQVHLGLRSIRNEVWTLAPWWFKHADGQVSVLANAERGNCPTDFNNFGTHGQAWISGVQRPLAWLEPGMLEAERQTFPGQRADPLYYTLKQQTVGGVRQLDVWPTPGRDVTILLKNYAKIAPEFIDAPMAPGVAINIAAGNLTGPLTYRVTYVHPYWETEGGYVSASITPAAQKADIDPIPVSKSRRVTARKLYRTAAAGVQHKLATTISDNLTIRLVGENLADGSLGANVPIPATAITGLESFPADFHEQIFVDGLIAILRAATKQVPFNLFSEDWRRNLRRMWADQQQDRHVPKAMPLYGSFPSVQRRWRTLP